MKFGVPQESILGPLLFVIYINGLLSSIIQYAYNSNLLKFANDVKFYKAIHNLYDSQCLQFDVDLLFQWSLVNKSIKQLMCCFTV